MGAITKHTTKNGKIRYVASVRQNRKGNNFSQSKTFSKESSAKEWIRKTEAQLELNGNRAIFHFWGGDRPCCYRLGIAT